MVASDTYWTGQKGLKTTQASIIINEVAWDYEFRNESWPLTINYYYLLILTACLLFTKVSITTTLVKDQLRNTEKILTSTILFYTICIKYNFLKTSIEFGTLWN